ncbi:MAG: hypothetical protein WBX01_16820 [Nitrososphaeraceae archaeon]
MTSTLFEGSVYVTKRERSIKIPNKNSKNDSHEDNKQSIPTQEKDDILMTNRIN